MAVTATCDTARRALLLDRDGVINVNFGYVHRPEQVVFVDGIFDLVRTAVALDYLIVIVTNQAGIGRGLYTEETFLALMAWMAGRFEEEGGRIDKVYWCPDHPEHGMGPYRRDSWDRKPNPGMIERARDELSLDLSRCVLVGDAASDIEAGRRAGVGRCLWLQPDARLSTPGEELRIRSLNDAIAKVADRSEKEPKPNSRNLDRFTAQK